MLLPLVASCSPSTGDTSAASTLPSPTYRLLSPSDHLTRASMAIRGTRPSLAELETARDHPEQIPLLIDTFLEDPRFGETIKDWAAEQFLLRTDVLDALPAIGPLRGHSLSEMYEATSESPLRLVEEVVMDDHPLTTLVTADWVWTNEAHHKIYGLAYNPEGPTWQRSTWTDGRPVAGLLSDSEMWRRYESAGSNFHRLRANVVAATMLCEDFNTRDIDGATGVDISNEFEVANAVRTNPACVNCHQGLDPLAAFFWGFKKQVKRFTIVKGYNEDCRNYNLSGESPVDTYTPGQYCYPLEHYTVSDETQWAHWDLRGPGYYGTPLDHIGDLGDYIQDDPRFGQCMARSLYAYMTQTARDAVAPELVSELYGVLKANGMQTKPMVRHIALSDSFRAISRRDARLPAAAGLQTVRPEQLARTLEDLTGFRWLASPDPDNCVSERVDGEGTRCWNEVDLATSDRFGFRAMSGGVNGYYITAPTHTMTPPKELVMERYAFEAATYVTRHELELADRDPRLFDSFDADQTDADSVRSHLSKLHQQVLGEWVRPDGPEVDATYALWHSRFARDRDPIAAWTLTLAALFQDPRMSFY